MGGGGGSAADPPPFVPIDIPFVENFARLQDEAGYKTSDRDYAKRFPQLVKTRGANIQSALSNLKGEQDPLVTSALNRGGLGDVTIKRGGREIEEKRKRDRDYFKTLLSENPQRQIGLSGKDIVAMMTANTGGQNVYNEAGFQTRLQGYNAGVQQSAQNTSAVLGGITGLAKIGANYYQNQNQSTQPGPLDVSYYTPTSGTPQYFGTQPYGYSGSSVVAPTTWTYDTSAPGGYVPRALPADGSYSSGGGSG